MVFLGTGAAVPSKTRGTTSQFVDIHGHTYLIDAGEGVQMALRREGLRFQRLRGIFISHMHGDHVLGLPGLLSTMSLLGRKSPLTVWGPPVLESWLRETWSMIGAHHTFDIHHHAWSLNDAMCLEMGSRHRLVAFPVKHRIACCGLRIEEHSLPWTLQKGHPQFANLSHEERRKLKRGEGVLHGGVELRPDMCCDPPPKPRAYVYSADTRPSERVRVQAQGAEVLYHDATFQSSDSDRAKATYHSTAAEAGRVALQANVRTLVLGHLSQRYKSTDGLLAEAGQYHSHVLVAHDGMKLVL
ncbi:MAG: ribonuclease Z [Bacteroidetes bacterium]|nr:ribonuclease Z [Bacteroidota bacterium]